MFETEIHLIGARRAIVRREEIETIGVRRIQRSADEIGIGLRTSRRRRGLERAAQCQDLTGNRRYRATTERGLHLIRTGDHYACAIRD